MEADFVVVWAGSGGAAAAFRLAEAGASVIVVEAGGSDAGPFIAMPGALSYPMHMRRYDWGFVTEPEPGLGGRRLHCPRGRVLGGSSSINGMVYVRGHGRDFDHWEAAGAAGWGWADVAPYFRRLEDWRGPPGHPLRGRGGPVTVTPGRMAHPLFAAFVAAGGEAGYPLTDDTNGPRQEGFGPLDATIRDGVRWSSARAYLRPALASGRCRLVRGLALRVAFAGRRARGVEVRRGGREEVVAARRAVVLAASAINTPKLLMLSGIGPGEELRRLGLPVLADRPGVGANLQDHLEIYLQYAAREKITLRRYWNLAGKAWVGLAWLLGRRGPGASNQFEAGGFIRSAAGIDYPDIQFHFLPIAVRYDGRGALAEHGFQAHVGPMRSQARGRVRLVSPRPEDAPAIRFDYLSHADDLAEFRTCLRLGREIFAQPAIARHVRAEIAPGPGVVADEAIDDWLRAHAETAYHPCGTARLGAPGDPLAVADPAGRVIGVEGLAIADSALFPRITNGNLNAPSMMAGEKVADHLLGRPPLPRETAPPWINPDWRTRQR
ncbi:MAG: choline dehydrogenase [Rhodobacteraceae bacterium]|nr:choline dehydrogenase [Paracoccaceae bacterium]